MMEAGKNLLSSPPFVLRTHVKNCPVNSSSSVLMLREQTTPALTFMPAASSARHFPTSVLVQEQRDDYRLLLHTIKEDRTSQSTSDRRTIGTVPSKNDEDQTVYPNESTNRYELHSLPWRELSHLFSSPETRETNSLLMTMQSGPSKEEKSINMLPEDVVSLAKKALSASRKAALIAEDLYNSDFDDLIHSSLESTSLTSVTEVEEKTVRSKRLLERRLKRRRVPKPNILIEEIPRPQRPELRRKANDALDQNDPLRLFLGPETKQLLTAKEEAELILKIQDLMKLEEVKSRLQTQFAREPTLVEWAEAVGLSCRALKSQLHSGNRSREKLIYANFRMVVHIAKQYQGRGLNLQDLLQEGSMGLMRSVEKFKPQAGCRFPTYAYWWIRQAVRRALFQHSRTVRLPDNVYGLLSKVTEAKRSCIQQGHHRPTKEQIALSAGMTVEKLEKLLFNARMPLSMQQPVWTDQDTTFQEITADTAVEVPDVSVSKQLMRKHVRHLLTVLSPKERKIIQLRFGIGYGKQKSLSEIGAVFGLSKERVRQLESRALYKLKQCLNSHGLDAYEKLLF